jgi:UDP-N-acetylmuramoylalanine--D-glutamate ligase
MTYHLGGHDEADLEGCDLLVVNPAVDKRKSPFFQAAARRDIAWTSEMNLFLERCPGLIVGVTGTVGKSTTTAMIGAILEAARSSGDWRHGRVWLGGNIGKSLLDELPAMGPQDVIVLELSSFQLEDAAAVRRSPQVAVVTNVRDNHLDRHGTLPAYAAAKANIYRYQGPNDWLILPFGGGVELLPSGWADRPRLIRFGVDEPGGRVRLQAPRGSLALSDCETEADLPDRRAIIEEITVSLSVPGVHNLHNAAGALAVSRILGAADDVATEALSRFAGLAHRLEFVARHQGIEYYNDSKATTPEAAITSLKAFDGGVATITSLKAFDGGVVMLVGGSDKGSSFAELGAALGSRAKAVVCMGATRDKIRREIHPAGGGQGGPVVKTASSLADAFDQARQLAATGDVVLLSPGCASFDWFRNYEHRGAAFKDLVAALG